MSIVNMRGSEAVGLVAQISPQSSSTTLNSGWVSAANFDRFLAKISVGTLGSSATVDAKIQQAKTSGGGTSKDITGKAITQLTQSPSDQSNSQFEIDFRGDEMDVNNGYTFFQLSITCGTAASLVQGDVWGFGAKETPTTSYDLTSVLGVAN